MSIHVIRAADCRRMPWKNGGGETVEIAVSPAGAALDAFDWRVSMAKVAASGPFSTFPGIERTLSVLEGDGIRLETAGRPPIEVTRDCAPVAFPADIALDARLAGGPITDLNVMTRRGRFEHRVRRLQAFAPTDEPVNASIALLFCGSGGAEIRTGEAGCRLGPLDTLMAEDACGLWRIVPDGLPVLLLIEIARLA